MARMIGGTLSAVLLGLALVAGCGPALSVGQAPGGAPSEFVPGHRPVWGTTLRYYVRYSTGGAVVGTLRYLVPGPVLGEHDPDPPEFGMTYHILSVDWEGNANVRVDLDGKPLMAARVRRDGTLVGDRLLNPEVRAPGVEVLVGIVLQTERRVRVGDAIPFRHQGKGSMGKLVGTVVLRRFSPVGRCWAAELQGTGRLDPSGWQPGYDQKTRRHFRTAAVVVDVNGRSEIRTGAMLEAKTVVTFEHESIAPSPPGRTKWAITTDVRLDPASLGALGCS